MDLGDLAAVKPNGSISPFLCVELFQSTGDPGGAEVAGMTIPEHGHIRIPVQTAPMGGVQIGVAVRALMASSNDRGCSETGCGLGACVIDSVSLICPVTVLPFVSAPDDRRLALSQKTGDAAVQVTPLASASPRLRGAPQGSEVDAGSSSGHCPSIPPPLRDRKFA